MVTAGCLAGASYTGVVKAIGRDGALIALAVVLLAVVVWKVREQRTAQRGQAAG